MSDNKTKSGQSAKRTFDREAMDKIFKKHGIEKASADHPIYSEPASVTFVNTRQTSNDTNSSERSIDSFAIPPLPEDDPIFSHGYVVGGKSQNHGTTRGKNTFNKHTTTPNPYANKQFTCNSCSYQVNSTGGEFATQTSIIETIICKDCTDIVDVSVAKTADTNPWILDKLIHKNYIIYHLQGLKLPLECPNCQGSNTELWVGHCPKCSGDMILTNTESTKIW